MRSSLLVRPGQRAGMAMGALRLAHVSAPASAVHEHRLLPVHLPNHPDPVQTEVIAIAATTGARSDRECAVCARVSHALRYASRNLSCIADKPEYQVLVLPGNPGNAGEERQCSGPALLQPRTALRPQPRLSCPSARRLLPQVHEHASHIIERQGPRHLLQPRGSRPSSHREKGKTHAHTYNIRTYTAFHSACL